MESLSFLYARWMPNELVEALRKEPIWSWKQNIWHPESEEVEQQRVRDIPGHLNKLASSTRWRGGHDADTNATLCPNRIFFFFSLSSLPAQLFLFFFFLHYCPPPSDFFFLIPVLFRGEDSCCFWLEWKPSDRELHLSSWYPSPRLRMVNSSMAGRKKKQQNNLYFRAWKISGSFIYFYLFILFLFPSILVLLSNFLSLQ